VPICPYAALCRCGESDYNLSMPENKISIIINRSLYPLEAAQAAACAFAGGAYAELDETEAGELRVTLAPKEGSALSAAALRGEFMNELLHHAIRLRVSANNAKIREYIVTQALLSAKPEPERKPVENPEKS